jgi:methyltransferase (TIGR00027 family)
MEQNQVSMTAIMTAYIRSFHALYDAPKIFDDFLAYHLLSEERRAIIEQALIASLQFNETNVKALSPQQMASLAGLLQFMGASIVLSRSRYTEDKLETAVKQGVKQYIILGAGMDTFAFRRLKLMEQLQVFEVDHPATQAFKRNRITELEWKVPSNLHFVSMDFTQEKLITALMQSSFDLNAKSFFSWLGVTMYLTREEVLTTLGDIAHSIPSGSTLVFDYHDNDTPDKETLDFRASLAQQAGELMKSGFDPATLSTDLSGIGLRLLENLSPIDIEEHYFQGRADGYHAAEHAHIAYAVVE